MVGGGINQLLSYKFPASCWLEKVKMTDLLQVWDHKDLTEDKIKLWGYYDQESDRNKLFAFLKEQKPYNIVHEGTGYVWQEYGDRVNRPISSLDSLLCRIRAFYHNCKMHGVTKYGRPLERALVLQGYKIFIKTYKTHKDIRLELMTDLGGDYIVMQASA